MSKSAIKRVAIVLKPEVTSEFMSFLPILTDWLNRRKKEVCFLESELSRVKKIYKDDIKNIEFINESQLHDGQDLIITLGGDGTLIGACRHATRGSPPIFGTNMGKLGFITEFSKVEFYDELTHVLEGNYETVRVPMFSAQVFKKDKRVFKESFLNDVVFNKLDISRMFTLSVESDDEHIYNISGDGLIVSSPVGSTAYSLAAGGPIIHPAVGAMVITPICPHSLTHRPLVIPDHCQVKVRLSGNVDHINVTLDGQSAITISEEDLVVIKQEKRNQIRLIKNQNRTYFHTLKEKFTHGRRYN